MYGQILGSPNAYSLTSLVPLLLKITIYVKRERKQKEKRKTEYYIYFLDS